MELYKKIAGVRTLEEYYDMQEELEDRYGDMPKAVQLLLEVVLVKAEAHAMGITSITQKHGNILLEFLLFRSVFFNTFQYKKECENAYTCCEDKDGFPAKPVIEDATENRSDGKSGIGSGGD